MNSNLFSNSLLTAQDPFTQQASLNEDFAPWDTSEGNTFAPGFQNDGSQMPDGAQSFGAQALGENSLPPGLFAAIASAISQYFHGSQQQQPQWFAQQPTSNIKAFQNVNVSSTGDPHDAISGTTQNGNAVNEHWDNMQSHNDLLSAPSLAGGFQLSSQVASPNGQGATMNQTVTATADHGRTAISFSADGQATVTQGNTINTMIPHEVLQLGNGLSVTDQGSSLVLQAQNMSGSALKTTLSQNGNGGVDVSAQGQNVALGGYLVNSPLIS